MKDSLFVALAVFLVIFTKDLYAGEVDIDLDVSLGSEVGPSISSTEVMPFVGQVEVGYETGSVKPYGVWGHTSSADVNGSPEYHGEFYGAGVQGEYGRFYGVAQAVKYYNNDLEGEGNFVGMFELGVQQDSFRFGAFYENARSGYLERMGLKFGYEFDLL